MSVFGVEDQLGWVGWLAVCYWIKNDEDVIVLYKNKCIIQNYINPVE